MTDLDAVKTAAARGSATRPQLIGALIRDGWTDTAAVAAILAIEAQATAAARAEVARKVRDLPLYPGEPGAGVTATEAASRHLREYRAAVLAIVDRP